MQSRGGRGRCHRSGARLFRPPGTTPPGTMRPGSWAGVAAPFAGLAAAVFPRVAGRTSQRSRASPWLHYVAGGVLAFIAAVMDVRHCARPVIVLPGDGRPVPVALRMGLRAGAGHQAAGRGPAGAFAVGLGAALAGQVGSGDRIGCGHGGSPRRLRVLRVFGSC